MAISSGDGLRTCFSFGVLVFFLTFVFVTGVLQEIKKNRTFNQKIDFPDFGHYNGNFIKSIPDSVLPIDDQDKRIIAIGDIHGMNSSLTDLLDEIQYDSERDSLIHVGDLETRATIHDSIDVLSFMSSKRLLGVRGNNDQKVIEWRAWMNWILSLPGGQEWLSIMDKRWPNLDGDKRLQRTELEKWVETSKYASWKKMVPTGWHPLGKHYRVARAMSPEHFEYLSSLPLVLRSPNGHMVFVHADDHHDVAKLRNLQELAVLTEIPENKDPWTLTNIKSVTDTGIASPSPKRGTPWSQLWNDTMSKCSGNSGTDAGRGLDIKRWSIGLDTGCSYGRQLSAIVLNGNSFSSATHQLGDNIHTEAPSSQDIVFGDNGQARIVSVSCA
ncbi:Metallo-dependent phosphatase-like protein [Suillus bovinus]|uniref:Metallo-dependent phosphatase-like protein n=1 Tax=Suillus bovinus TaxID=48563 RepID=UPI001B86527D|nr:Metallo-dependent phosphatase-like protein [Suillus bovinus]KAG2149076.1 Metallo-dependent phosphatase-like protein [Suillus bovinus]